MLTGDKPPPNAILPASEEAPRQTAVPDEKD